MKGRLWLVLAAAAMLGCGADVLDEEPLEPPEAEVAALEAQLAAEDDYVPLDEATAMGGAVAARAQALGGCDRDGDGICDGTEEWLLRRYRPYYRFSASGGDEEKRRPADAVRQMGLARFGTRLGTGDIHECGRSGDNHLDPPRLAFQCRGFDASVLSNPTLAPWCLDMNNDSYDGDPWEDTARTAPGLYGHAVPDVIFGRPAVKLEYWQYFAQNDQDLGVRGVVNYDHEGDWCGVQLWLDKGTLRPLLTAHLVHGKELFFDLRRSRLRSPCEGGSGCFQEVQGRNYSGSPGDLNDSADPYQNNAIQLYWDGAGAPHPVVYIERNGHEFWPGAGGEFIGANEHNGAGRSYLPVVSAPALTVGEVSRPLSRDKGYVIQWNGYWGCTHNDNVKLPDATSPPGPALHCAWRWADRPEERAANRLAPEPHPDCEDGFAKPRS